MWCCGGVKDVCVCCDVDDVFVSECVCGRDEKKDVCDGVSVCCCGDWECFWCGVWGVWCERGVRGGV